MTHPDEVPTTATAVAGNSVIVFTYKPGEVRYSNFDLRGVVANEHAEKLIPGSIVSFDTVGDRVYAWMVPAKAPTEHSTFYITDKVVLWRDSADSYWDVLFTTEHATLKDIPAGIHAINVINPEVLTAADDLGDLPEITEDVIVSSEPTGGTGRDIHPARPVHSTKYNEHNRAPEPEPLIDTRESVPQLEAGNRLDNIFVGTLNTEQGIDLIVAAVSRDIELARYLKHRLCAQFSAL